MKNNGSKQEDINGNGNGDENDEKKLNYMEALKNNNE